MQHWGDLWSEYVLESSCIIIDRVSSDKRRKDIYFSLLKRQFSVLYLEWSILRKCRLSLVQMKTPRSLSSRPCVTWSNDWQVLQYRKWHDTLLWYIDSSLCKLLPYGQRFRSPCGPMFKMSCNVKKNQKSSEEPGILHESALWSFEPLNDPRSIGFNRNEMLRYLIVQEFLFTRWAIQAYVT